jgi:microcystin-dependent protein
MALLSARDPVTGNYVPIIGSGMTLEECDARYEPVGSVAAHVALADPHPTYLTQAEGDARYLPLGGAVPTGTISPYAGSAAPTGYLLCQGQSVSRSTYATLFAVCGVTYGVGDGSTTFNLPNLKGRLPVGLDTGQTEFNALNASGGAKTHTLTIAEMPMHQHAIRSLVNAADSTHGHSRTDGVAVAPNNSASETYEPVTTVQGSTAPHNNLQPYLTVNFIIKT